MKHRGEGFKRKVTPEQAKPVGLAFVSYSADGRSAVCSCGGWAYTHPRLKVLDDAIDRHILRKHDGRGIRR